MIGQGEGPLEMPGASTEEMLQYKLTAAEERVAEMRKVLEDIEWVDDTSYGLGCPLCGQAHNKGHDDDCAVAKALSAAPKRGRVLWRGVQGRVWYNVSDDLMYVKTDMGTASFPGGFQGLRTGQEEVTVTVREAE